MRYGRILTAIITILLLVSILPAIPSDTADADTASDGSTFFEDIAAEILDSLGDISDSIVAGIDDAAIPPGSTSIIDAVANGDEVPVSGTPESYEYTSDYEESEIYLSSGHSITVGDGVTVTVGTLYILSSDDYTEVTMGDNGKMIINHLVVCGLPVPIPSFTIQTPYAKMTVTYDNHGGSLKRDLFLSISEFEEFTMTVNGHTVGYVASEAPSSISVSVKADLTNYVKQVLTPETSSPVSKLMKFIGSMKHIGLDVDIKVDATYSELTPKAYEVGGLHLYARTPEYSIGPYALGVSLGSIMTSPVDVRNIALDMTIPSDVIEEDKSLMDKAGYFKLSAGSIDVDDTDLTVGVKNLGIELGSAPEPYVEFRMGTMSYAEILTDSSGTYDMSTDVSGFTMKFTGSSSDLLDNPAGLIKSIILSLAVVEGTFAMDSIDYQKADHTTHDLVEGAKINKLVFNAKLSLTQFVMHFDLDSFTHRNPSREVAGSSIGYDLLFGVDPSINPESVTSLIDLLKALTLRSTATIKGDGPGFILDEGRRFIIGFATEGLKIINGDDSAVFDRDSIKSITAGGDVTIYFHRLTGSELNAKVPSSLRSQLNGGCVIELTVSDGRTDLGGQVTITVKTDLNPKHAGAYRLDTAASSFEKKESTSEEGSVTFKTDTAGIYAVSGKLIEPSKITTAIGVMICVMILGAVTAYALRRH